MRCRSLLADNLDDGVTGGDSGVGLDGKLDIGELGGVGHGHDDAAKAEQDASTQALIEFYRAHRK